MQPYTILFVDNYLIGFSLIKKSKITTIVWDFIDILILVWFFF